MAGSRWSEGQVQSLGLAEISLMGVPTVAKGSCRCWSARATVARAMERRLVAQMVRLQARQAPARVGAEIPARMAMVATATRSSRRVSAFRW